MEEKKALLTKRKRGAFSGCMENRQGKTETGDCITETIPGYKVLEETKQEEVMVLSKQLIYDIILDWVYENKLPVSLKQMEELGTKIWEKVKPLRGK